MTAQPGQSDPARSPRSGHLTFAAEKRCPCGAGLAYAPGDDYWDCSAILLGTADKGVQHTAKLPFVFYEIKSENQPSANGRTTR